MLVTVEIYIQKLADTTATTAAASRARQRITASRRWKGTNGATFDVKVTLKEKLSVSKGKVKIRYPNY